ncbi:choice-of-anchor A family protein [Duganella sp. CY15W]|uniref:collagen-binding domain-containing protein n=1 Tax=Duganella sp. CY15W TaxID=2692172 RepID=UPI0013683E11|nr:collagen-binding domain-containing protein [Duganella sp. CY15W]MYM31461.1 choice-of-anchor A family protein [Duganella sp. CY15W]
MRILKTFAVGAVATFAAASAPAATLTASQILTQFNSVVSGNFSTAHDVEGRLVANNLVKGATFYNNPSNTPSAFSAVNAINIGANGGGNINNGGSVNYVTSNAGSFNLNGSGGSIKHGVPTFSMADFTTPLNALESQLAGLSNTNGTLNAADPNNFTFNLTGNASSTSVFNLTTSQLGSAANINFSGTASTVVINVRYNGTVGAQGQKEFSINGNFNDNSHLGTHIIWNFVDTTQVNFRGWYGTVLAGTSTVTNTSAMNGFLYAANFVGDGELHDRVFAGTLPAAPVPEPATWGMMAVGLAGLALARRRQSGR